MTTTRQAITLTLITPVFGASLALGLATLHPAIASADESVMHDGTSFVRQPDGSLLHVDDKTHLPITEDDPRWSCVDDGNRVCGPHNANHVPAGCYDDGGVWVAPFPCRESIDPATGDTDVFTPDNATIPFYVY